jgi:hypothetical protein
VGDGGEVKVGRATVFGEIIREGRNMLEFIRLYYFPFKHWFEVL